MENQLALNGVQEKIKDLLAAGVSQTQVAAAVGVSDGYISQLMEDENFRTAVIMSRGEIAVNDVKADQEVDDIEEAARQKIKGLLAFETKISTVLKVYQVMNAAKRKTEPTAATIPNAGVIVNISLPQKAIVDFTLTADKQVVEVAGRSMATLPSNVVHAKLREKQAARLLTDTTQPITDALIKKLGKF